MSDSSKVIVASHLYLLSNSVGAIRISNFQILSNNVPLDLTNSKVMILDITQPDVKKMASINVPDLFNDTGVSISFNANAFAYIVELAQPIMISNIGSITYNVQNNMKLIGIFVSGLAPEDERKPSPWFESSGNPGTFTHTNNQLQWIVFGEKIMQIAFSSGDLGASESKLDPPTGSPSAAIMPSSAPSSAPSMMPPMPPSGPQNASIAMINNVEMSCDCTPTSCNCVPVVTSSVSTVATTTGAIESPNMFSNRNKAKYILWMIKPKEGSRYPSQLAKLQGSQLIARDTTGTNVLKNAKVIPFNIGEFMKQRKRLHEMTTEVEKYVIPDIDAGKRINGGIKRLENIISGTEEAVTLSSPQFFVTNTLDQVQFDDSERTMYVPHMALFIALENESEITSLQYLGRKECCNQPAQNYMFIVFNSDLQVIAEEIDFSKQIQNYGNVTVQIQNKQLREQFTQSNTSNEWIGLGIILLLLYLYMRR